MRGPVRHVATLREPLLSVQRSCLGGVPTFQVLKKGFVLVYEPGIKPDEAYVLVFAPFLLLCAVAEEREINFELIPDDEDAPRKPSLWDRIKDFFTVEDRVTPTATANFKLERLDKVLPEDLPSPAAVQRVL